MEDDERQQQEQQEEMSTENGTTSKGTEKSNSSTHNHNHNHHHPLAQAAGSCSFPGFFGKHRMQAAISHLNNQIIIIQEELEELETIGESSTVCENVISSIESIPDPLLPIRTKGPVDATWDRWFGGGTNNSRSHKRWI
ncbi:guanine nucleotide-binding protein subunit gamma 1-like isoform X1 [Arachis stenosperma]|uniref:guanine nucleotide-binding protein subunit gamma 1-like isoform X1 n=1 Tax=Arachis stenosperma TaxID=217475 RepID=UPI0025AD8F72|nr:guanine nucleotide-binding protein subunit gamma 1-like isoform X1 [Arachis stenosperma]